ISVPCPQVRHSGSVGGGGGESGASIEGSVPENTAGWQARKACRSANESARHTLRQAAIHRRDMRDPGEIYYASSHLTSSFIPDEFPTQRSLACICDGCLDRSEHDRLAR